MTELLRIGLVTWCWLFVHGTSAARTRSLRLSDDYSSEFNLTTPEFIDKHGYPVETHTVESDGYILTLHRIPRGRNEDKLMRPAVIIHHALLCSSFDWVVQGPDKALGFILADEGYDVWLANARGNTYSRKHVSLDPSDTKFWEFSWHEMGTRDVPAEIDYILATTGHKKLFYIGHSMGTTMFFVMMSQRPEYNAKVRAMIAFAPEAHFTPSKSRIFHFIQSVAETFLEGFFNLIGYQEFLPQNSILNPVSRIMCKYTAFTQGFCIGFMEWITGKSTQLDKRKLTLMLAHTPAGCSTRQVTHYAQLTLTGEFQQFDFGEERNMKEYNQSTPPSYNLKNVTVPVSLHYSDNDRLAPYKNVKFIAEKLPNLIGLFRVPFKMFNHIDFMWGNDARYLVYSQALKILNKYKGNS